MEDRPVIINIERMEKALNSESIEMPGGLNREEMRAFIIEQAQKVIAKEKKQD